MSSRPVLIAVGLTNVNQTHPENVPGPLSLSHFTLRNRGLSGYTFLSESLFFLGGWTDPSTNMSLCLRWSGEVPVLTLKLLVGVRLLSRLVSGCLFVPGPFVLRFRVSTRAGTLTLRFRVSTRVSPVELRFWVSTRAGPCVLRFQTSIRVSPHELRVWASTCVGPPTLPS